MELRSERTGSGGDDRVSFLPLRLVGTNPPVPQAGQRNRFAVFAREEMGGLVALRPP
jgi:hypothetical protein